MSMLCCGLLYDAPPSSVHIQPELLLEVLLLSSESPALLPPSCRVLRESVIRMSREGAGEGERLLQ